MQTTVVATPDGNCLKANTELFVFMNNIMKTKFIDI